MKKKIVTKLLFKMENLLTESKHLEGLHEIKNICRLRFHRYPDSVLVAWSLSIRTAVV